MDRQLEERSIVTLGHSGFLKYAYILIINSYHEQPRFMIYFKPWHTYIYYSILAVGIFSKLIVTIQ